MCVAEGKSMSISQLRLSMINQLAQTLFKNRNNFVNISYRLMCCKINWIRLATYFWILSYFGPHMLTYIFYYLPKSWCCINKHCSSTAMPKWLNGQNVKLEWHFGSFPSAIWNNVLKSKCLTLQIVFNQQEALSILEGIILFENGRQGQSGHISIPL